MRQTVCKVAAVPEGGSTVVSVNQKPVAVFRVNGEFFAIDDRCPHAGASLSSGKLEGTVVTCPWHAWRFRVTDGTWVDSPRVKTGCYAVHVVGDEIQLEAS